MKQLFLSALAILLCATSTQAQVSNNNEDGVYKISHRHASLDFVPGEVLVKFHDGAPVTVRRARGKFQSSDNASLDAVLQSFGVEEMEKLLSDEQPGQRARKTRAPSGSEISDHDLSQLYRLRMAQTEIGKTTELVEQLATLPEVEYAEPNYRAYIMGGETISQIPEQNPSYPLQWGITALKINELWTKPIVNPSRPIIAILDTGVDTTHPDLKDNIWSGGGYDFVEDTNIVDDYNGHGTHVAGIAAAVDNGEGIIGANPCALIMPVTVLRKTGSGDIATIIRGVEYATNHNASIINMSLGMYVNSNALQQVLEQASKSAIIVAAAGNNGLSIDYAPTFPAAYPFVVGVMASQPDKNPETGDYHTSWTNYDEDGPNYSKAMSSDGDEGYNYEMTAPGEGIMSAYPRGRYKMLSGTSMAAPLISGAISALQMVRKFESQEDLRCILSHSDDFMEAYNMLAHQTELNLVGIQYNNRKELATGESADNDVDSEHITIGDPVRLYPIIRSVWGNASSVKLHLEVFDDDADAITILENDVDFGFDLLTYEKQVSKNPLTFVVNKGTKNGRIIKIKLIAICDNEAMTMEYILPITVWNVVKLKGYMEQDMTLTPDYQYLITSNLAIPEGVTLTIKPGTNIQVRMNQGIACSGKIVADGKPDSLIVFELYRGEIDTKSWNGIECVNTTSMSYCKFRNMGYHGGYANLKLTDCILERSHMSGFNNIGVESDMIRCNLYDNFFLWWPQNSTKLNIANNRLGDTVYEIPEWKDIPNSNYLQRKENGYVIACRATQPSIQKSENPSWLGTAKESVIRPYVADIDNGVGFGKIDLSNMLTEPIHDAHGIVWKVVVNGYDAQDEYDMLPPLGIGRHKFEVWYNRPMNKSVAPHISFGVREPYTQNAVEEDGAWNENGTIYTAYATITSRTASDGVNRIYVYGGEDDEHFECPYEKSRFNINIQAASSMSTGFSAEGGGDHITLTWNNTENDIDDAMGYNIYRYTERTVEELVYDEKGNKIWDDERNDWQTVEIIVRDTIRINPYVIDIDATSYTDRAVTDGETYYYFYKLQGTNLKEYGMSNTVRATTNTSGIAIISADERRGPNGYYDLSGRRLNRYPAKKGVYIIGRKKVVVQ